MTYTERASVQRGYTRRSRSRATWKNARGHDRCTVPGQKGVCLVVADWLSSFFDYSFADQLMVAVFTFHLFFNFKACFKIKSQSLLLITDGNKIN